ncbi:MAG: phytanoyl-CoA dioxygenase family protein [Actinomycetes bacterium]
MTRSTEHVERPKVIDYGVFHDEVLDGLLSGDRGVLAANAAKGLRPLVLSIGDRQWTYTADADGLHVTEGSAGDIWVAVNLSPEAWSDLATSMRTVIALHLAGELEITVGSFGRIGRWEGALRALYLGIPAYDPERVELLNDEGTALDITQTFSLDDDDAEMAAFLATTGYLHVTGVLNADEIAVLVADTERISEEVSSDDPLTWWATRPDDTEVLCRVIYAQRVSQLMGDLVDDPRMRRLADLLGSPVDAYSDRMDGPTLLIKPAGELRGLSNLPWHQDCGLGAHPITCPSVALGVQITGSSAATGRLEVIAGSHGQSVPPGTSEDTMDRWPKVAVDTKAGDVTVHIQDVLHSSPPPTDEGGRATLYLSYYPPGLEKLIGPGQAINDLIRGRQGEADAVRGR